MFDSYAAESGRCGSGLVFPCGDNGFFEAYGMQGVYGGQRVVRNMLLRRNQPGAKQEKQDYVACHLAKIGKMIAEIILKIVFVLIFGVWQYERL